MRVIVYTTSEAERFERSGWVLEYRTACAWSFVWPWPAPVFD